MTEKPSSRLNDWGTMFSNSHLDRLRQQFADQFQPEGEDYLYRKYLKGAPVRVSAEERQRAIAAFEQRFKWLRWLLLASAVAFLIPVGFVFVLFDGEIPETGLYIVTAAGLGLEIAVFAWAVMRLWNAPAKVFAMRSPVGRELTRDEVRRLGFARLSWGQLLGGWAAFMLGIWALAARVDVIHGWGRLWLAAAAGLTLLVAGQAYRKWRYERE